MGLEWAQISWTAVQSDPKLPSRKTKIEPTVELGVSDANMQKEEKRRKFHQSVVDILYPPPASPPDQEKDEEQPVNILQNCLNADLISDEFGESSSTSSSDDEGECGPQKLTRAQRKRIRKKKVKEAAASCESRRRKLIGPLLPGGDDGSCDLSNEAQGVPRNVGEKSGIGSDNPGVPAASSNQNKRKHRRMAKKLAKERSIPSTSVNLHQDCGPCSNMER